MNGQHLIELLDQLGSDNVVLERGISLFDADAEGILRAAAGHCLGNGRSFQIRVLLHARRWLFSDRLDVGMV